MQKIGHPPDVDRAPQSGVLGHPNRGDVMYEHPYFTEKVAEYENERLERAVE